MWRCAACIWGCLHVGLPRLPAAQASARWQVGGAEWRGRHPVRGTCLSCYYWQAFVWLAAVHCGLLRCICIYVIIVISVSRSTVALLMVLQGREQCKPCLYHAKTSGSRAMCQHRAGSLHSHSPLHPYSQQARALLPKQTPGRLPAAHNAVPLPGSCRYHAVLRPADLTIQHFNHA